MVECSNYEDTSEHTSTLLKSRVIYILYDVFMAISIFFIILTILAYIFTPEMKNLHGKCIIFQCAALAVAYIGFIILHLTGSDNHIVLCKISGIILMLGKNMLILLIPSYCSLYSIFFHVEFFLLDQLHVF